MSSRILSAAPGTQALGQVDPIARFQWLRREPDHGQALAIEAGHMP